MMFRRNLRPSGEEGGRSVSGGLVSRRVRRALVVAEFALAIVLVAGAGLLIRSWWHVARVDPGFTPERMLMLNLTTNAFVAPAQRVNFYADVLEQVESLPGVESAGMIGDLFITSDAEPIVTTEGNDGITSGRLRLRIDEVSDRLFATLRTPLLRGRFFSVEDGPDAPRVAIVNDAMARRLWPDGDPVGRRFKFGPRESDRPWLTVVGVVGDMRRQGLETEPIPQMFQPLAQNPSGNEILLVRTSSDDPLTMVGTVQAAVRRVDKNVPLSRDDPGRPARSLPHAAPLPDLAPDRFLRRGAPDGRHRDLRAHPLLCGDAHAGNRHPHGRRRTGRRHFPHDRS